MPKAEAHINQHVNQLQARQKLLEKRKALPLAVQKNYALQACNVFVSFFKRAEEWHHVAAYYPFLGELSPRHMTLFLKACGACMFYPVIAQGNEMFFSKENNQKHTQNRYGILEPNSKQYIDFMHLDALLIPLVAFDKTGHRIGMGGGFYDRFLSQYPKTRSTLFIGLGYEFQKISNCMPKASDICLDYVVTEKNVYQFT